MPALPYPVAAAAAHNPATTIAAGAAAAVAAAAEDTRILDSRQLHRAAGAISHTLRQLSQRIPGLARRQSGGAVLAIPTQYAGINSGPAPGAVAGIVLGSVAGFLFLIWLLWIASSGSGFIRSTSIREEDITVRRRSRSRATRRSHRTEMTSRSPRRERVVRQERIVRNSVPPPQPREPSRMRETIVVEERSSRPPPHERRVEGDDMVEVIEEHSSIDVPPPRRKGRGSSVYRRDEFL